MARDMDIIRLGAEMSELVYPGAELPAPNERVITRGGGSTLKPFFYAAKNGDDLIIAVRGAAEPGDFMIVLDFARLDFAGGKAHRGVLGSARWIIEQTRRYIDDCTGRIICCGHSLGGATSAMVAAVLLLEEHRPNVFAVSMAPFPIMTRDVAGQLEATVTSFAFRNDVVPKLTARNIGALVQTFVGPPGPQQQQNAVFLQGMVQQLAFGILQMNVAFDPSSMQLLQAQIPQITQNLLVMSNQNEPHEFFLPGKAYYISNDQDGVPYARLYTEQDAAFNIAMLLTSLGDHRGELYNDAIFALDDLD